MKNRPYYTNDNKVDSNLYIELDSIYWGSVALQVHVDDEVMTTAFSDFDDRLSNLVKFINEVEAGGFPSARITDHSTTTWAIESVADLGMCRFTVALRGPSDWSDQPDRLSVPIDRKYSKTSVGAEVEKRISEIASMR